MPSPLTAAEVRICGNGTTAVRWFSAMTDEISAMAATRVLNIGRRGHDGTIAMVVDDEGFKFFGGTWRVASRCYMKSRHWGIKRT